jgi:hypothetical protein
LTLQHMKKSICNTQEWRSNNMVSSLYLIKP